MQKVREHFQWYILALLFVATLLVWYAVAQNSAGKLKVAFLDVGQGDAIFIESPTGNQILVDGGPTKGVLREIGEMMPFYDRTIDLIIITNPDKDHFGGFIPLIRSYRVASLIEPGTSGESDEYAIFSTEAKKTVSNRVIAKRGQIIDIGGGAKISILFPDRDVSGLSSNDGSIVAKLVYGNTSFLLTGDTTEAVEKYLGAIDKEALDSDVLKAAHHGSKTSSSEVLIGLASPAYAVISAGKDNKYGHPHKEVLDRLREFEVKTLGTYDLGTIEFESDGEKISLKK